MLASILADRQRYAMGVAAHHMGGQTVVYRPSGCMNPLSEVNRLLKLDAAFQPARGGMSVAASYGDVEWHGIFDASHTRCSDILVGEDRIFFIAAQEPLLPVLCIRTNRRIAIGRPEIKSGAGIGTYGGYVSSATSTMAVDWPASITGIGAGGQSGAGLPMDQGTQAMTILLPTIPNLELAPGDIIADDLGRTLVVTTAEPSALGWRLSAKLATA